MNIGLLEDNPALAALIATMLELAGHHVSIYQEGKPLLETLFRVATPYDLLIIDLEMPGEMSGYDVIQVLRKTASALIPPIVVVSGAGQQKLASVQKEHPDVSIVRKPFRMKPFLELIEQSKGKKHHA